MVRQLESKAACDVPGRADTQSSASTTRRWCSTARGVRSEGSVLQRHATDDSVGNVDNLGSTVRVAMTKPDIATMKVQQLLELPGAMYVCVINESTGGVLSEFSRTDTTARPSATVLRDLAQHLGSLSGVAATRLEDVMMTSDSAYHLIRRYSFPGTAPALVYLRLDRRRANLGIARRAVSVLQQSAKAAPPDPTLTEPATVKQSLATSAGPRTRPASRTPVPSSVSDTSEHLSRSIAPQKRVPHAIAAPAVRVVMAPPPALPRRPPAALPRQNTVLGRRDDFTSSSSASAAIVTTSKPAVLSQSWSNDVSTLSRLLEGLRRLA